MTAAAKFKFEDGGRAWEKQHQAAFEKGERVSLPTFDKPEHVQRDVFGGYLVDATAKGATVHRVAGAAEECQLDGVANVQFVHFWHQVQELFPKAEVCKDCSWEA